MVGKFFSLFYSLNSSERLPTTWLWAKNSGLGQAGDYIFYIPAAWARNLLTFVLYSGRKPGGPGVEPQTGR